MGALHEQFRVAARHYRQLAGMKDVSMKLHHDLHVGDVAMHASGEVPCLASDKTATPDAHIPNVGRQPSPPEDGRTQDCETSAKETSPCGLVPISHAATVMCAVPGVPRPPLATVSRKVPSYVGTSAVRQLSAP